MPLGLPKLSSEPVGFWPFFLGTLRDAMGNGNGSVTGPPHWTQSGSVDGILSTVANGRVDVADAVSLRLTTQSWYLYSSRGFRQSGTQTLVDKAVGNYRFQLLTDRMRLTAGGVDSDLVTAGFVGAKSIAVTLASGAVPTFYADHASLGVGDAALTPATGTDSLYLLGDGTSPVLTPCEVVAAFGGALTVADLTLLDAYCASRITPRKQWPGGGLRYPMSVSGYGKVGAWDADGISNGSLIDRSASANNGDVLPGASVVGSGFGNAICFDGVSGSVNLGDATEIRFNDGSDFSVSMWIRPSSIVGVVYLMDNFDANDDGWAIRLVNGVPWISINTIDVKAAGALTVGVWQHVVFNCDRSGNGQVYVDGAASGAAVDISGQTISTVNDVFIGSFDGTSSFSSAQMISIEIFNRLMATTEIEAAANRSYPMFLDNIQTARVTLANQTSGKLSNTPYQIESGTWKLAEDTTGERYIECVVAGIISRRNLEAYGTWEFCFYKAETSNTRWTPINDVPRISDGTGYMINTGSTESYFLFRLTAGGASTITGTGAGYIAPLAKTDITVTRSTVGAFTSYVKDAIRNNQWAQMAATAGSNPRTDNTHAASLYCVYDFDAGDRLYCDRQFAGVIAPV